MRAIDAKTIYVPEQGDRDSVASALQADIQELIDESVPEDGTVISLSVIPSMSRGNTMGYYVTLVYDRPGLE